MEEKKSSIGLFIAIIALLVGVGCIFLGVLPAVELKGKVDQLESRLAKAEKTADSARNQLTEWKKARDARRAAGGGMRMAPPAPLPQPVAAPLPPK